MTHSAAIACTAILASVSVAAQAAQSDGAMQNVAPHRPANQAMMRPGQFILNGHRDVELVRFSKPHDVLVCLPPKMDVQGRVDLNGSTQYPVIVTWDDDVGEIWPGNCLGFDAAKVKVSPSPAMPKSDHVEGQIFIF